MKTKTVRVPVIRTDKDHEEALTRVKYLFDSNGDGDELELLGMVIQAYEDRVYPSEPADPVQAVKFAMEQRGYTNKDLGRTLGAPSRASEFMHGKRRLTVDQIRKLNQEWGIPLESLVSEAKAKSA